MIYRGEIAMSRKNVGISGATTKMRQAIGERVLWAIDYGIYDANTKRVVLTGWLLDTRHLKSRGTGLAFRIGDFVWPTHEFSRFPRDDTFRIFSFLDSEVEPLDHQMGFAADFVLPDLIGGRNRLMIEIIDLSSRLPVLNTEKAFVSCSEKYPVPDEGARYRVHGTRGADYFLRHGLSLSAQILERQTQYRGVGLNNAAVLDWGCGSGRVARYLADACGEYIGIDIDKENVDWCAANLPGKYFHIDLKPPTVLHDESFDLIFGISVFTHLSETSQFEWLMELSRLAKPGALVMVTVLGSIAACRTGSFEIFEKLRLSSGYMDLGSDPILNGYVPAEYYRTALHTKEYVQSQWGKYFQVVEIVEGAVGGGHQDLVVLRKPVR